MNSAETTSSPDTIVEGEKKVFAENTLKTLLYNFFFDDGRRKKKVQNSREE